MKTATRLMILVAFVATALLVGSTSAYAARTEAECMLFFGPEQEDCLDSLSSVPAAAPAAPAPQETAGAPAPVAPAAAAKKPAAPKKEPKKPAPAPAPAPAPQTTCACLDEDQVHGIVGSDTAGLNTRVGILEEKANYNLLRDPAFWLVLAITVVLVIIVMGALFRGAMRDDVDLLEASFGLKYKKLKERMDGMERLQLQQSMNELTMQAMAAQGEVDRLTEEVRALESNLTAAAAALESAGDGAAFRAAKDHQKTVVETLEKQRKLLQESIARHEKIVAQQKKDVEGRLAALDSTPDDHDCCRHHHDDDHGHGGHEPHGH